MQVAIATGAAAGLVLFLIQWAFVTPLIRQAEVYEGLEGSVVEHHAHDAWEPADGFERLAYTGLGTVLTGVGFSAVFFGVASLIGLDLNVRRGLRLGAAGFLCFALAPSIGLPPTPPGVSGPDLHAAQWWWVLTVVLSGAGLWLLMHPGSSKLVRGSGALALAIPHLIGAPAAPASTVFPSAVIWRFAVTAIGTQAIFWLTLGALGGWVQSRSGTAQTDGRLVPGGSVDRA